MILMRILQRNLLLQLFLFGLFNVDFSSVSAKLSFKDCARMTDGERNLPIQERIVGGKVMPIRPFPFMVGIVVKKSIVLPKDSVRCGGSIISLQWVLTAAHCLRIIESENLSVDMVYIVAGSTIWNNGRKHNILNWKYHKNFEYKTMDNDIAVIRVKERFSEEKLEKPIPVAAKGYKYKYGTTVTVIGWGVIKAGTVALQDKLRGVSVDIFNQTCCELLYAESREVVTDTMFCAGTATGGKDACDFDSGGPIFDGYLLIGIVSWGLDCGKANTPGVYTRVSLYTRWITEMTNFANVTFNSMPGTPITIPPEYEDFYNIAHLLIVVNDCLIIFSVFIGAFNLYPIF